MNDQDKLHVASTSAATIESKAIGRGRLLRPPGRRVPAGLEHAVRERATRTVCGLDVEGLREFPDATWHHIGGQWCLACEAALNEAS